MPRRCPTDMAHCADAFQPRIDSFIRMPGIDQPIDSQTSGGGEHWDRLGCLKEASSFRGESSCRVNETFCVTIILTGRTDSRKISGRDRTCPTVSSSMVGLPMATARRQDHRVPAEGYRGQQLFPHPQRAGTLAELARTSVWGRRRYPDGVIFALDACRCLRLSDEPVLHCSSISISTAYTYLYYIDIFKRLSETIAYTYIFVHTVHHCPY